MVETATSRLLDLVYQELKAQAARMMGREGKGHTLQTTALVHEAFLKLAAQNRVEWKSRAHVLAVASIAMRRILVNHARRRRLANKARGEIALEADPIAVSFERRATDLLALDDALKHLAKMDLQQARIVELRFFGGLTVEETAQVLGISERAVHREWAAARAWLRGRLGPARLDKGERLAT